MLIVDGKKRTITIPAEDKIFGVTSDEKTQVKEFRCPRYTENNLDLSQFSIRINYINAGSETDQYIVRDVKVVGENIEFSWELSRNVTLYRGNVQFIVCAVKTDAQGMIQNEWNTTYAIGQVLQGIEVDGSRYEEETSDAIESILLKVNDRINTLLAELPQDYRDLINRVSEVDSRLSESIIDIENLSISTFDRYEYGDINNRGEEAESQYLLRTGFISDVNLHFDNPEGITVWMFHYNADKSYYASNIFKTSFDINMLNTSEYKYVRWVIHATNKDKLAVTYATKLLKDFESIKEKIPEIITKIDDVMYVKNLFDKSKITLGKWLQPTNGNIGDDDSMFISDYIPAKLGDVISCIQPYGFLGSNAKNIATYDNDKKYLGYATGTLNGNILTVTLNNHSKIAYIRFTDKKTNVDTDMCVYGTYPQFYIKHGYIPNDDLAFNDWQEKRINPLFGKKITLNGDSICYGQGYTGGYGKILAERNNMNVQNIAVGGGTIAGNTYYENGNPRHWICRTISNMDADADYAIVEGGINDGEINGNISEGYSATLDDTTFCGAFESMLKQLISRFKGKKIGYIFVHKCTLAYDSTGNDRNKYWLAKQCCEKWGVPYLDLNTELPPLGHIAELKNAFTWNSDGWHPNEECYRKYYVPKIEAWMKTL